MRISDNFLSTVEGRIVESGVGELAADIARYEAASSVEIMLTRVRFDLIGKMFEAVGPLDLSDMSADRKSLFQKLSDKIGGMQFAMNFTPEAS